MNRATLATTALALTLGSATLAAATPAGAAGPQVPIKGAATLCLTPAADQALAAQGVELEATAPATLDTTGPTPCVTTPVTSGAVSLDLASGGAPMDGALAFVRTADGRRADFTELFSHLATRTITATTAVDHGTPAPVDFLTYTVSVDHVRVNLSGIDAAGLPMKLAPGGAQTLQEAFGATPVAVGEPLFTIDGHADLLRSVLAVPVGLTG
ncbi:hypothetical protein ACFP3U_03450 [Kitasatospora misakiensis]|uniref:Uncharacterized protein n=1 Tax=Kitasatospora misakiensis TaxID=67330 RepID=A0ABW0WWV7_9ACTN